MAFTSLFVLGTAYILSEGNYQEKLSPNTDTASSEVKTVSNPQVVSPTPSPTARPLTFSEMNQMYGPCAYVPTLMYHHVQSAETSKAKGQTGLSVYTDVFKNQMDYLKAKGYSVISMADLTNFFDNQGLLPKKPLLLTFDDAYSDFYSDIFPILQANGYKATVFTPTGLVNNPNYLSWDQITGMAGSGLVEFANHTWSHKSMKASGDIDEKEISLADYQLAEKGLNSPKVFAYPYGGISSQAMAVLGKYQYRLAFTTKHGATLCAKQRLALPRIRIGNASLGSFGL